MKIGIVRGFSQLKIVRGFNTIVYEDWEEIKLRGLSRSTHLLVTGQLVGVCPAQTIHIHLYLSSESRCGSSFCFCSLSSIITERMAQVYSDHERQSSDISGIPVLMPQQTARESNKASTHVSKGMRKPTVGLDSLI